MPLLLYLAIVQATRRRLEALAEDRAILAESNSWAQAKTAQMEATFTGMTDGVMMLDADLRLLEWNQHFPEQIGIDPAMLRVGLPMEAILRAQAVAGEFGPVDVEAEVARRLEDMRTGASSGTIERVRPNGRTLELRRKPVAGRRLCDALYRCDGAAAGRGADAPGRADGLDRAADLGGGA